jgi:hypothetical protein
MYLCKICQSSTKSIIDTKKELIYYRCDICGFIYLDDTYMVDKVQEKKQYDQHNNSLENEGYVQMFEDLIDLSIEPYRENIQTVLEFGSGPEPVLAELLERRALEVDIYDLYYSSQKIYEGKKYDLITSTEVFEHLEKPLEVLGLLVKNLHENAYVVLMTKFPPKGDNEFLAWWYRRDPTHISFFTPKSFEVIAERVGLKVLKIINENIVVFQKSRG